MPLAGRAYHHVAGAGTQRVDACSNRDESGADPRIKRQGPAFEIERLGDPRGERAARKAAGFVEQGRHLRQQVVLVLGHHPVDLRRRKSPGLQANAEGLSECGESKSGLQLIGEISAEFRADNDADALPIESLVEAAALFQSLFRGIEQHELQVTSQ